MNKGTYISLSMQFGYDDNADLNGAQNFLFLILKF